MLAPSPASEPRYTAFPRVCDIDKNALGQASAIDMKGCEDELAAAEVCKLLIEKVAEEEQRQFIQKMVGKASNLKLKYKEGNQLAVDEDGVIRSPTLPRYTLNLAKVNQFLHKKLPKPLMLPIMGCSVDADLYTMCTIHGKPAGSCKVQVPEQCDCAARELARPKPRTLLGHVASTLAAPCPHNKGSKGATEDACNGSTVFDMGKCFGFAHGFVTDVGIVAPPSDPVFGFIYHEGEYKLFAEPA